MSRVRSGETEDIMWRIQIWSGTDEQHNNITPSDEDAEAVGEYAEEHFENFRKVDSWAGGLTVYFDEDDGRYGGADWGQIADELAAQVDYDPSGVSIGKV